MEVCIRPLTKEDAYTSVKWRNDPEVFKYTGNTYQHIITIETELEWIQKVISTPNDFRFAIMADGVYVGNIYLTNVEGGVGSYHIFIGERSYWGKGVAKKASELIIEFGFNKLNLDKITLGVDNRNTSAVRLYEKLGFKEVERHDNKIKMALSRRDNF